MSRTEVERKHHVSGLERTKSVRSIVHKCTSFLQAFVPSDIILVYSIGGRWGREHMWGQYIDKFDDVLLR